ncbi:MAG TPA: NDP-sugar synthase [Solirubrobacteraceae bacterium]|nr:NDP-sugar synthase [Solirubrobacteraceae bacterium]
MQALILVGGEGTRLRPLTSKLPKPVVTLVDRPFMAYMLEWLKGHGVSEVILSCGFMADGVSAVLGDGSSLGLQVRYVQEPEPLGTGGALKYAEEMLEERFLMLNGDVLTDIDLTAQLRQHEATGASVTLALYPVQDPSAYGLVNRHSDHSVRSFVEKPRAEEIETNLISAGAYVIERPVLDRMAPAGTRSSIERDLFPELVGHGLYGYEASGYWMDIGTPDRYLQATYDILDGEVSTAAGRSVAASGGIRDDGARIEGRVHGPAVLGAGCVIEPDATVSGRTVLGPGVHLAAGAHVESSVLLDGCRVGAGTRIVDTILAPGVTIGERCQIDRGVVLGQGVTIGAGNVLTAGMRIFPGVQIPDGAVAF